MPRPIPQPDGRAARLLAATLRPEARVAGRHPGRPRRRHGAAARAAGPAGSLRRRGAGRARPPRPSRRSPPPTSRRPLGSAALDLVVVWWSARVSWRAGNRLRERLAAHALRLEQAWHGRHSPGQLIERIDGDVEAMAIFFAGMAVQIAGNVALILGMLVVATAIDLWTGLVLTVTAVAGAAVMVRLRMAAVGAREARARGQRPALRRPRGAARRARGHPGQRRRAATPSTGCTHHSARSWRAARKASLRGDGAYAASAIVFAVGTAAHARGRHRAAAAGRHHHRRRPDAVPLRRHAPPPARDASPSSSRSSRRRWPAPAGRRRCSPPSPRVADGPDDGVRPARRAPSRSTSTTSRSRYAPDDADATPALRGVDLHLAGRHPPRSRGPHGQRQDDGRTPARPHLGRPAGGGRRAGRRGRRPRPDGSTPCARRVARGHPGRRAVPDLGARQPHAVRQPRGDRRRACAPSSDEVGLGDRGSRPSPTASTPPRRRARPVRRRGPAARVRPGVPRRPVGGGARRGVQPARPAHRGAASRDATERLLAGRTAVIIAHRLDTLDRVDEIAVLDAGPARRARPAGRARRGSGQPLRPAAPRPRARPTTRRRRRRAPPNSPRRCRREARRDRPRHRQGRPGSRSMTASPCASPATSRSPTPPRGSAGSRSSRSPC